MGRAESPVEEALVKAMAVRGAIVRKVTYQGRNGAPDRWGLFPGDGWLIVEAKAPGEKPEPHQLVEMNQLRRAGAYVAWVDTIEKARQVVQDFSTYELPLFNQRWKL